MAKPQANRTVFSEVRKVFARFGLDDTETFEASVTLVAVFARVLGIPRNTVFEMLEERLAGAALLDPREQGWTKGSDN